MEEDLQQLHTGHSSVNGQSIQSLNEKNVCMRMGIQRSLQKFQIIFSEHSKYLLAVTPARSRLIENRYW